MEKSSPLHQFTQQGTHHCRVLRRAFADTEYRFASIAADVSHRQDHLDVGVLFGGEPAELLHGPLLIGLVSFLHSGPLPFLAEKTTQRRSRPQV